ncbi:MAG: 4Fe-4S ferredoxin [Candidatus Muproteobacteria bacterium RBG_16_65_31]|uniref:4Fe-4S ferredoxin n=1 Tax=Candidatus Muproteobacteria bacterium RBG_16_65_31 TaxID=1817759 RepID=A0A1F6TEP3_9PROT|nr:MAG: 4Fe-4S ferredoxin [Candidatus Muproteobacteria bacterium RBG_16_65_31]
MTISRREVLGLGAAAVGATLLAPGLRLIELARARSPEEAATSLKRWGLLIDASQCGDCDVCVTACHEENGVVGHGRPATDAQWIRKVTLKDKQTGYVQTLPLMCQHCEEPPCVDVCPTGASFKRADGIVLVDKHICIGCRYCMMACPYKARSFVHEDTTGQKPHAPRGKGTVESCTLCVHRVDAGKIPACVEACNKDGGKAMLFGDLKDPESEIAQRLARAPSTQIRPDLNLNTGVRYRNI